MIKSIKLTNKQIIYDPLKVNSRLYCLCYLIDSSEKN